jgi:hypothetical protein
MKWVRNVLFVIIALAIAGCGGGGGEGSSAGSDSFVVSLDSGTPVTYYEVWAGDHYEAYMISMESFPMATISCMYNWNGGGGTYDDLVMLAIEGTSVGDFPLDSVLMNTVMYMPAGGVMYSPDYSAGNAGTITVDVYDTSRIQGIYAVNMVDSFDTSNRIRLEGSFDLEPGI